jgi:hypothetical protein
MSVGEEASMAWRASDAPGLGLGTMTQLEPVHRSISVWVITPALLPTAHTSSGASAVMPNNWLVEVGGLGLRTTCQQVASVGSSASLARIVAERDEAVDTEFRIRMRIRMRTRSENGTTKK